MLIVTVRNSRLDGDSARRELGLVMRNACASQFPQHLHKPGTSVDVTDDVSNFDELVVLIESPNYIIDRIVAEDLNRAVRFAVRGFYRELRGKDNIPKVTIRAGTVKPSDGFIFYE